MIPGQGWGMPFIVSPNYTPQDPEYTRHYKPEQQGCADCNGVSASNRRKFFSKEILTCDGIKTIETSKPPDKPPVINREMDKQYLGAVNDLKHTRIIGRSTRNLVNVQTIIVNPQDVV
jgi:hypothetical protein